MNIPKELIETFDRNSPESVKYSEGNVDVNWLTSEKQFQFAEQLAGIIMDKGLVSTSSPEATYEFYFKLANATDYDRLTAFNQLLQL
tara:strand:- start:6429 stop:6689 length:261 start_codon:yes stop_codon:yes gene_type:complete